MGLKEAQKLGAQKVILEVDSLCAVQLCQDSFSQAHVCRPLIMAIRNLRDSFGEVQIVHQFREANFCADGLAKLGHHLQPGFHIIEALPSCISLAFHANALGITHSRVVSL